MARSAGICHPRPASSPCHLDTKEMSTWTASAWVQTETQFSPFQQSLGSHAYIPCDSHQRSRLKCRASHHRSASPKTAPWHLPEARSHREMARRCGENEFLTGARGSGAG